jgi:hypothetical protein
VVANYGGSGLWRWTLAGGWQEWTTAAARGVAVDSGGDVPACGCGNSSAAGSS